jgi:predicted membrane-bound spermidine synthase
VRVKKKPVPPVEAQLPPGLRPYLYITAAITGGAIMIVEILGAKMLSPYLGTSHFVWTAQIAVTLVALACGYYVGGWFVDRSLQVGRMYTAIFLAGLYLALTIPLVETAAYTFLNLELALGSLITSTILYFVPLGLLAMVGPFCIRVMTSSVHGVGGNVGRLTALSTLGSFLGTVLIGYLLIPYLPNSQTMYGTAMLLGLVALVYFLRWGRRGAKATATVTLLVVGLLGYSGVRAEGWTGKDAVELFRGNSNFGLLQVMQQKNGPERYYLNDYLYQNTYDTNAKQSVSMFTYMLHGLAQVYTPQVQQVLCIGMGVGIVPMDFARGGAKVDLVEINPAVLPIAQQYFNFEPDKLNLTFADGRQFVNRCSKRYDAIILDAFLGDSSPSHLMTREAFTAMRRLLTPEGVLVINTFAELDGDRNFFGVSLYRTLTNVFASGLIHAGRNGNTLFVGSTKTNLSMLHAPDYTHVYPGCIGLVKDAFNTLRVPQDMSRALILTDDYNPVEVRDASNREQLRRNLALRAKGVSAY